VYVPNPLGRGVLPEVVLSQPGGESRAIYSKERILSKYEEKFTITREDN
jgi:hypothetical protein